MIKILAVPGSLRVNSSSHHILNAISGMMPTGASLDIFDGVGYLPHFNDATEVPESVARFREKIRMADAVLICTPEYAFGVPGSLKNALDWTVSSGEFMDKPVGLVTASSQGERGHAALLLILTAISASVIDDAALLIPSVRSKLDVNGLIKDPRVSESLSKVAKALIDSVQRK